MSGNPIVDGILGAAIGLVKLAGTIIGEVDRAAARDLEEVRQRLEDVRQRARDLPIRGGEAGDWARRAEERRREIAGEGDER